MSTTYYIEHNGNHIDQDTSIDALYTRLQVLAEANPDKLYRIAIDGPGNPLPQETPPAQPLSTGTQPI